MTLETLLDRIEDARQAVTDAANELERATGRSERQSLRWELKGAQQRLAELRAWERSGFYV